MATAQYTNLYINFIGTVQEIPDIDNPVNATITPDSDPVLAPGDTFTAEGGGEVFELIYSGTNANQDLFAESSGFGLVFTNETLTIGSAFPSFDPTNLVVCFGRGTLIATPEGERRVETLQAGDPVLTADGRAVPVLWVGRQTLARLFTPAERLCGVRIRAGALGDGKPHTDLTVTPDHGLLVEGIIVHAGALVNETSIVRVPVEDIGERITYWHVETAEHDFVVANGVPAETFIDNVSRRAFDNYAEFEAEFGPDVAEKPESSLPRAMSRRQVPASLRAHLDVRAQGISAPQTGAGHAA
jgi:hypothetical protein